MSGMYPPQPEESSWRRVALGITVFLGALAVAASVIFVAAVQLTDRRTAQPYVARALSTLVEIDRLVLNAWPVLEAAAAQGEPVTIDDFPIALQIDPAAIADGPEVVADEVAAASASLIYDNGLEVLSDTQRVLRLVSQGGVFDASVGRLTSGGRDMALVGLMICGGVTLLLLLGIVSQTRGLRRIGMPALSIALGAALVWLAAVIAQSAFEGRAESTTDPFAADLWLLAADAISMLIRDAAVAAAAAGVTVGAAAFGGALLMVVEQGTHAEPEY